MILYKITNLTKNKSYIGVSKHPDIRTREHLKGRGNKGIALDLDDNFQVDYLCSGSERYIYDLESKAIALYGTLKPAGYNVGLGGEGGNITDRSGELNTQAKLTKDAVKSIRIKASKGVTHSDLAKEYNVSRETISTLVRGDSWSDVGGPLSKRRIVAEEDKLQIRSLYSAGMSIKDIQNKTGWSFSTVHKYKK